MRALGTFTTKDFHPTDVTFVPWIETALPGGVSTMQKIYAGDVSGRSATLFIAAFNPATGIGAYTALEAFEGSMLGKRGSFNFIHSATTQGEHRTNEFFSIVAGSGTAELTGIQGTGGMAVERDGTHRIWFDAELPLDCP